MLRHIEPLGQIDWAEGARKFLEINRPGVLVQTDIRFRFTITNGVSAAVGPLFEALAALIKRIEFTINGRDTIISIDGPGAVARARYEWGNAPEGSDDTVVLTGSAATAYDIFIPIPHFLPRSAAPLQCALPVNRLGQTTLTLTFGDISDFYATPNSATIGSVTIDVFGHYLINADPNRAYNARILDTHEVDLAATSDNLQIVVDTGTGLNYRSMMLATLDDGVASDALLDAGSVRLDTGQFNFQNWDAPVLQADNKHRFNVSAHQTGIYFLATELFGAPLHIPTARSVMPANLIMGLDVVKQAGTNTLRLYRESIRQFKQ